eukprot:Rhum_TRINITY_DN4927_c0_g1::Rhum_TRINITY_DN4927_c0_g1_i1::g.16147::m.16147
MSDNGVCGDDAEPQSPRSCVDDLKAAFEDVEYATFAVAHERCRRLARRILLILNELELSGSAPKPALCVVLLAALHLCRECLSDAASVPKMLLGYSLPHVFAGLYVRLRRVWGSCPPVWCAEDDRDGDADSAAVLAALEVRQRWEPCRGGGRSELWRLLAALPASSAAVRAKLARQHAILDFTDLSGGAPVAETADHTLTAYVYRGSHVVLKETRGPATPEDSQLCVLHGTAWVKLCHPHLVPVVAWATTRGGGGGGRGEEENAEEEEEVRDPSSPRLCCAIATLHAPGHSLEELWCVRGVIPTPQQLLTLCRQVAQGLLYVQMHVEDEAQLITELPLDNVMVDLHTGAARVIPGMPKVDKRVTRWHPPANACSAPCYMVGLLLWCAIAHTQPMPHVDTQEGVRAAVRQASWRPEVSPLAVLPCLADLVAACTAAQGEDGYRDLSQLLEGIDETLADVPQDVLPLQLSTSPIPMLDKYGSSTPDAAAASSAARHGSRLSSSASTLTAN